MSPHIVSRMVLYGARAFWSAYSIVEADSLGHAKSLIEGHPYLSEGAGNYSIEVFELMPVPFES